MSSRDYYVVGDVTKDGSIHSEFTMLASMLAKREGLEAFAAWEAAAKARPDLFQKHDAFHRACLARRRSDLREYPDLMPAYERFSRNRVEAFASSYISEGGPYPNAGVTVVKTNKAYRMYHTKGTDLDSYKAKLQSLMILFTDKGASEEEAARRADEIIKRVWSDLWKRINGQIAPEDKIRPAPYE